MWMWVGQMRMRPLPLRISRISLFHLLVLEKMGQDTLYVITAMKYLRLMLIGSHFSRLKKGARTASLRGWEI